MNKQQLASKIWESANQMRSKIEANEYKDYILGFIFYKYLSYYELKFARKEGCSEDDIKALSEDDPETVEYFKTNIGYFISYNDLFSTWIKMGNDFDVSNVRDALSAFSRLISNKHKKLFTGIFDTLQTGLSKLGDTAASQTKSVSSLLHLIKDIPMDGKQDYDVLGFIYEYLIGMFAANAGKKAGEFYTPHEVSLLMSEIVADHLKDRKEIQIYDPTSGSGSLLINIGKSVARHIDNDNNIKYYAQELKQNTYNLTRMNLIMRGILADNIVTRNGDTLEEDWPYFDENDPINTYNPLYVDAVVSNPPYSQKWDSENKDTDPRYSSFGLAPKTKADYAFLLHDLYHLKPDGIMTIILPHGVLFRGGEEGAIRRNLIEKNHIDAVIGLPANIFFGTGIPTIIMVLKQKRNDTDVLIVDASKGFIKVGKNNMLQASDIKRIVDTVIARESIQKFSRVVSKEEIRENDYNLNIPRYVDSSENAESWDIYSSMFGGIPLKELDALNDYWAAFPSLRDSLFTKTSDTHAELKVEDVKSAIKEHSSVKDFTALFEKGFHNFDAFLKTELIEAMDKLNISKEESVLTDNIFNRIDGIPLIDKYEAYQLLDDDWIKISADLEMIQTEGFSAVKKVDPHMVMKKKNGVDHEVQDGWQGHIIPFDLIQSTILKNESDKLKEKENRLSEITSTYDEILDSFSEEEKEAETVKESKDSFVNAAVKAEAKQLNDDIKKGASFDEESYEAKIIKISELLEEEASLKKEIKTETDRLHLLTKETIEKLIDEKALELLELKWISSLVAAINKMPKTLINSLASRVQYLSEKYSVTFSDIENNIHDTEVELNTLIDELQGNESDMKGLAEFQKLLKGEFNV